MHRCILSVSTRRRNEGISLAANSNDQSASQRPERWAFPPVWAGFVLALVAVTYPVWFPIGDRSDYPMLGLFGFHAGFVSSLTLALASTVTLLGSLLAVITVPNKRTLCWWLVALALVVSFLVDQHRLQPWAYQTAIYAVVFAVLPAPAARRWLIPLAASIYIYSAGGKFDYQFAHTVGQDFLTVLASPFGGIPVEWDLSTRAKLALLFPTGELVIGIGLLLTFTRRYAAWAAMLFHGLLLAVLGPPFFGLQVLGIQGLGFQGLGHSTGVLVWNVAMMAQAFLLFMKPPRTAVDPKTSRYSIIAYGVVLAALLAPLAERHGYWDHWPSWALYSPHNSRVDIQIHASAVERLPAEVQGFIKDDTDGDSWRDLDAGQWSLSVRRVPIYPQARYQLELARAIADRYELQDAIRVHQRGVSDRWTGQRKESRLIGQREIEKALQQRPTTNA